MTVRCVKVRREYADYFTEGKKAETRERCVATTIEPPEARSGR
jgi:hypothetical protein